MSKPLADWLRLRLIYSHEAKDLKAAYRQLEAREDDWILSSRTLSYSQIALYLGAFVLLGGALFYFNAYVQKMIAGIARPFLVLGVPFAGLKPLGYLCMTGYYVRNFDWLYLALSIGSCLLSHQRQRRGFYIAGLMNTEWALYEIADHRQWTDKPAWAIALVVGGLLVLSAGYALNVRERNRRETTT